jgi:hypothetical protein
MTPQEFDRTQRRFLKIFKGENGVDNGNGDHDVAASSPVRHLADLLVEADDVRFPTRAHALRFLLGNKRGAALMTRMRSHIAVKRANTSAQGSLSRGSPEPTAKERTDAAAKRALNSISEHEFSRCVMEHARERFPNESPHSAFAKVYQERSAEGEAIRAARQAIKARQWRREHAVAKGVPVVDYNNTRAVTTDDWHVAYNQLVELRDELRRKVPFLTTEAAFAQVYSDPANRELVDAERAAKRRQLGG